LAISGLHVLRFIDGGEITACGGFVDLRLTIVGLNGVLGVWIGGRIHPGLDALTGCVVCDMIFVRHAALSIGHGGLLLDFGKLCENERQTVTGASCGNNKREIER